MDKLKRSYAYAGLAILFWSTVPTAFKISLEQLDVLPMLTIASVTSAAALFVIVAATGKLKLLFSSDLRSLLHSALLGLVNPALYYLILLKAYQLLPAQVAQPLNMIWPIVLVFLSIPVLKQKIRKKSIAALFICFAGVWLISSRGKPFNPGTGDLTGVLLATGSSVFWAVYFILNVHDKRDEAVKLFLNFIFGSIFLSAAMFFTGKWNEISLSVSLATSVYIGLFEMGITFYFWLKALRLAPTTDKVSNLVYITPFISLILVHFILREPVYYTTPLGLLVIITGILVQNRKSQGDIN